jgi:SSS family solute:Na+ symporter
MTPLDWLIVIAANGAIAAYGLYLSRGTTKAYEWFLASRGLPWWIVGLSMFATAVDSGDYVAVVGGAYTFGLSNLTTWWLGLPIGWFLVAYVIFVPLYRSGMYTNAEYLEHRFGPAVRLLSAIIQIQYRTNVLGNIAFSLYLTFSILTGWGDATWWLVVVVAAAAAAYTAAGGLKSVAMTDAAQSVVMFAASFVLWWVLWSNIGGWAGLEARFARADPVLAASMLHVGGSAEPGVPPALVLFGWIVSLTAYCVVNHSQAMRLLAARTEWDMKLAAFVAAAITAAVMWFNVTLGVLGRALLPDLVLVDQIYPRLVSEYLAPGLVGLVVAGVLAGGISSYDSIGSALAAVFTRDIYARFIYKRGDDAHYLAVSRWATAGVIAASFAYIPFLQHGMVVFYLRVTSVAVIPLFTVYLMGTLTRVHRSSGAVGLAAGILYGLSSFVGEFAAWPLPFWWTNTWWAYLWSIAVTATAMLTVTLVRGWENEEDIPGLVFSSRRRELDRGPLVAGEPAHGVPIQGMTAAPSADPEAEPGWLARTQIELLQAREQDGASPKTSRYALPAVLAVLYLAVMAFLNLYVLW